MNRKLNILDWYCHQGHQYEFFKTGHNFYLLGLDGLKPKWNTKHRPLNKNVNLISDSDVSKYKYDVVIIRSPVPSYKYYNALRRGARPIAVVQTTNPFSFPPGCSHVVWNSYEVMKNFSKYSSRQKHVYIVHGYDPLEFSTTNVEENNRVLTIANLFKKRGPIMGFDIWSEVKKNVENIDVVGHGNKDIRGLLEADSFEELINIYNRYSVYFNPTRSSAMPRSRAEAAMCGLPIVSTDNYDINTYFKNKKNAIITNDKHELIVGIKSLLGDKNRREEYGMLAREVAVKNFHIKDYIQKWQMVFEGI